LKTTKKTKKENNDTKFENELGSFKQKLEKLDKQMKQT
jgi:hypothetical protein